MSYCEGCGVAFQFEDPHQIGYAPKSSMERCYRCFRIAHYNENFKSQVDELQNDSIVSDIINFDGVFLWVVDLFDFEHNLFPLFREIFVEREVYLIITKRDLFPLNIAGEKILNFLQVRLQAEQIQVQGIFMTAFNHLNSFLDDLIFFLENHHQKRFLFLGMVNSGKSTLINALIAQKKLTTSYFPTTTLGIQEIAQNRFDLHLFDSPGLINAGSALFWAHSIFLKHLIPQKYLKPKTFQVIAHQSFSILPFFNLEITEGANLVFYVSRDLKIHRSGIHNNYFARHYLSAANWVRTSEIVLEEEEYQIQSGEELVFVGVGIVSFHQTCQRVRVQKMRELQVVKRQSLI